MFLELFAPQGLKGVTAAIQGFDFGGSCPFAAQIAPPDPMGCHAGILFHMITYDMQGGPPRQPQNAFFTAPAG
jgi:hypothetical protein